MTFNDILTKMNDIMYTYILIIMLVGAGVYFTIRTKGVQFRLFKDGLKAMLEKGKESDGEKKVSSFQALMISTASRVGTGNIAGIATAIATGGPGAVFWMWLMALLGGASAFIESTLAQTYKIKEDGQYRGGPSYYMERALGKRWLGILFSVLLIICFAYGFNGLQAYNMSSSLEHYISDYSNTMAPMIVGIILAAADVEHPVKQGLVQVISVFIDTILICSSTAFMLLLSGVEGKADVLDGIPYVQEAIRSNVGEWGIHFITFSIFAFAFSSVIGNYCYAESNILFIKNNKAVLFAFRVTCVLAVFLGAQADFSLVWNIADITMGFMAIVNIIAIFLLSKVAFKVLDNYEKQKREGKKPVFYEDEVGLTGTIWKRNQK